MTAAKETSTPVITNGVDVTALNENIEAITKNPELGQFRFRATNEWQDGSQNKARVKGYYGVGKEMEHAETFECLNDEPPVLLGKDEGMNPVEYLLAGLSGCMTTTLAYHAAARGLSIDRISSEYEGDVDINGFLGINPETRNGFQEIRVKLKVKGDATEEQIQDLVKKSPVYDSVANPVTIRVVVEKE